MTTAPPPDAAPAASPPPARRRRRLRWWHLVLLPPLLLILLVAAVALVLPRIMTSERAHRALVSALTRKLGVPVEIAELRVDLARGFELLGLRIGPPPGFSRDVFTAERLAVYYDLSGLTSRQVRVEEIALTAPHLVVETRGGRRNVEVLSRALAGEAPAAPPPERRGAPRSGPLSSVDVRLDALAVEDLAVELAGEGPNACLAGAELLGRAHLGRAQADTDLRFALTATASCPPPGSSPGSPPGPPPVPPGRAPSAGQGVPPATAPAAGSGVRLDPGSGSASSSWSPGQRAHNLELQLPAAPERAGVALTATVAVVSRLLASADVHDGLALGPARAAIKVRGLLRPERPAVAPVSFDLEAELAVAPGAEDGATVSASVALARDRIAAASVRVRGLRALLADALGRLPAAALPQPLGGGAPCWSGRCAPEGPGTIRVEAKVALQAAALAPYVTPFVPGLKLGGEIVADPLDVEGTLPELTGGVPRALAVRVEAHRLDVRLPAPRASADLALAGGRGWLDLRREAGATTPEYVLDARFSAERAEAPPNVVARPGFVLGARVPRLAWPVPGAFTATVGVDADTVATPAARVLGPRAAVVLAGEDVFAAARPDLPPVRITARAGAREVLAGAGPQALEVAAADLRVEAALDRLLAASASPIHANIDLGIGRAAAPGARLAAEGVHLRGHALVTDPRAGRPLDAAAAAELTAARIAAAAADLTGPKLALRVDAARIAARALPGRLAARAPGLAPETAALDVDLALPAIDVHPPGAQPFRTHAGLKTRISADLSASIAALSAFTLDLADAVHVRAHGSARDVFAATPWFDAALEVPPINLGRALAALPPETLAGLPGARASGTLGFSARVTGVLPERAEGLGLAEPPLSAHVDLELGGISAELPSRGLALQGIDGAVVADIGKRRTEVDGRIALASVRRASPAGRAEAEQLTLWLKAGLVEGVWQLSAETSVAKVAGDVGGAGGREASGGASLGLDVIYPERGDVEVRRFEAKIPGAGLEMASAGRLWRGPFGVLRPDGTFAARVDFDRLRTLIPEVGDVHGKLAVDAGLTAKRDTLIALTGRLELEDLSLDRPSSQLAIHKATGRVPFEQLVAIPAPAFRAQVAGAEGLLGDDLEARLAELRGDLAGAKLLLSAEDVLAQPPRTADYEGLRPYYVATGPELGIESVEVGGQVLRAVVFEGDWRSGVFRVDRAFAEVWDGEVLGDMVIQLTADRNVRGRVRGTLTDLNVDVPYALARHVTPVQDPGERDQYRVTGTGDLQWSLRDHAVDGRIDIVKLSLASVRRLFGLLLGPDSPALDALGQSEVAGVDPAALHVWLTRSLLSIDLDWDRVYFRMSSSPWWKLFLTNPAARLVLTPTLGSFVINAVNNSVREFSVANFLAAPLGSFDRYFELMAGRVMAEDKAMATAAASPRPVPP